MKNICPRNEPAKSVYLFPQGFRFSSHELELYYDCSDSEWLPHKFPMSFQYPHPGLATTHGINQGPSYILLLHESDKLLKYFQPHLGRHEHLSTLSHQTYNSILFTR